MEDKKIVQKIEQSVKESENWSVYHHLKDKLGYLFLDNGTPAEPGKPFSVQDISDWEALQELLDIIEPYMKK